MALSEDLAIRDYAVDSGSVISCGLQLVRRHL